MINSPILDVLLALVFIFFLFSVLVSLINEFIAMLQKQRGKLLRWAIEEVLNDSQLNHNYAQALYDHPLVDRMKFKQDDYPSYIAADVFAAGLVDILGRSAVETVFEQNPTTKEMYYKEVNLEKHLFERVEIAVEKMRYSDLKIMLRSFLAQLASDDTNDKKITALRNLIEKWYNAYMDRMTGWYKKQLQWRLFGIGLIVAAFMNVDAIYLVKTLWNDQRLRTQLVTAAEKYIEKNPKFQQDTIKNPKDVIVKIRATYDSLGLYDLPIGWKGNEYSASISHEQPNRYAYQNNSDGWFWLWKTIGILLAGVALSFGAPFWYDMLNKIVNMRKAGIKPINNSALN